MRLGGLWRVETFAAGREISDAATAGVITGTALAGAGLAAGPEGAGPSLGLIALSLTLEAFGSGLEIVGAVLGQDDTSEAIARAAVGFSIAKAFRAAGSVGGLQQEGAGALAGALIQSSEKPRCP